MSKTKVIIVLLGNNAVGKTSLIKRYIENKFEDIFISTVGVDMFKKNLKINDKDINLEIMDTCGQERYKSIALGPIRNVNGIIFVFDVTNEQSFIDINNWLTEVEQIGKKKAILIGNKIDLVDSIIIKYERMKHFADKKGMKCFQTSAKTGENVKEAFEELVHLILIDLPEGNNNKKGASLNNNHLKMPKIKKCCQ